MNESDRFKFQPINELIFVDAGNCSFLSVKDINQDSVGEKAYGLSCLPEKWTLPFFVISSALYDQYKINGGVFDDTFSGWLRHVDEAFNLLRFRKDDRIIVRSSSDAEGMNERGRFYSVEGAVFEFKDALVKCLCKINRDLDVKKNTVHLIVQKLLSPISLKGHLSNERRVYKESRDWLGEIDDEVSGSTSSFKINLRNWRHKVLPEKYTVKNLLCNLSPHISEILKIPAAWAYEKKVRLHYEWVWDGDCIYIVQADMERCTAGLNPFDAVNDFFLIRNYELKVLKEIGEDYKAYHKIHNALMYKSLGMPVIPLYVLDDVHEIDLLSQGLISEGLNADINELVKGSLVIRVDIDTESLNERQLLPRTEEIRTFDVALDWLKRKSLELKMKTDKDIVFIFHNFIPAVSSAFAYSEPGERKVQIESLWGLPEGLYYNSHDKYIVDTKRPLAADLIEDDISSYSFHKQINYKPYFVSPNKAGRWKTEIVSPPNDWRKSIKKEEWIKKIAYQSRLISEAEKKPLSIMWFVGIPKELCSTEIMPWYHERCDLKVSNRSRIERKKTPFDETFIIRDRGDIDILEQEVVLQSTRVKRIRIQPHDEGLLRDKSTLRIIGEISKKIDAVIILEGGLLSHAYYQLMQVDAVVEVMHPFIDYDETSEYNKLVRNKILTKISDRGETVESVRLSGEYLLRELKNKLIEESFEVLDAKDQDSILEEIADVYEVLDEILAQLKVDKAEVEERQSIKKKKVGGFNEGLVLVRTKNLMPTKKELVQNNKTITFPFSQNDQYARVLNPIEIMARGNRVEQWSDKRKYANAIQKILHLSIPLFRDSWAAKTREQFLTENKYAVIAEIKGRRCGSKLDVELSVFYAESNESKINQKQLKLFD